MKKLISLITGGLILSLILNPYNLLLADDFESADEEQNSANTLILDSDNTGGDITLQFGNTLAEFLKWNSTDSVFNISNSLQLEGTVFTIDADNTSSGDIVANQGSDNDGTLRYSSTNNRWEVSNDGSAFEAIATGSGGTGSISSMIGSFYDNTGGINVNTSTTAIEWGQEIKKDTGITHSTTINSSRIYIDEPDWYRINYSISHEDQSANRKNIRCRIRLNGSTYVIPSDSYSYSRNTTDGLATNNATVILETVSANEYYEIICNGEGSEVGSVAANTIINQSWTTVEKAGALQGEKGDTGEKGDKGDQGDSGTPSILAAVQARRTTSFTFPSTWADITLDTTDIETEPSSLEHNNANTDRIDAKEDGLYQITYTVNANEGSTHNHETRVRVNDSNIIPGSYLENVNYGDEYVASSATFLYELSINDYITLQGQDTGGTNDSINDITITIIKLEGVKGEDGASVPGTDSSTFTIDQDNTGGNLSLRFGTTLNETLSWNNTNSSFSLSDNLDINESIEAIEIGNGTANDITINFDNGSDHNFGWDDSEGNFSTFGEDIESECGPYGVFWSERGSIASDTSWALGNGQTPYGNIMGCDGRVKKFAATCTGTIGTSLDAVIRKNNVATSCTVNLSTTIGEATISDCNESFLSTDVIGIYAGTENGSWTECVGTFWVKYD